MVHGLCLKAATFLALSTVAGDKQIYSRVNPNVNYAMMNYSMENIGIEAPFMKLHSIVLSPVLLSESILCLPQTI